MERTLSFTEWLRRCRGALGLTQEGFAEQLGYAAVTYRKIEQGERPSPEFARKLAQLLAMPPASQAAFLHFAATGEHPQPQSLLPALPYLGETPRQPSCGNLPAPAGRLLGREQELARALELLGNPAVRLVTLSGPGGVGKTRLALAAATLMAGAYAGGARFLSLAAVSEPELLCGALAQQLEVKQQGTRPLMESLQSHLREQELLLVLDNMEQISAAAPLLEALLETAPGLNLLTTSRTPLQLAAEHVLVVPPLAVPDLRQPAGQAPLHYPSVQLFIERALEQAPDLSLGSGNLTSIGAICALLDGLPLAIELAAARMRLFSPPALEQRLRQQFALLRGGPELPERHQSLWALIDWSYQLLAPDEQTLFARLSVFAGGASLAAIEQVCGDGGQALELLEALEALLRQHMLSRAVASDGEPRFSMLETIRAYALEQLRLRGELEQLLIRLARYELVLAEQAEPLIVGTEQECWLERLALEHNTICGVLQSACHSAQPELVELGLRLGGVLWRFWYLRGPAADGRRYLEQLLARGAEASAEARGKALNGLATLAFQHGDYDYAQGLYEQSLALWRDQEDPQGMLRTLQMLSRCSLRKADYEQTRVLCEEALVLARELDDREVMAQALNALAQVASEQGDNPRAEQMFKECLGLVKQLGYTTGIAGLLNNLGEITRMEGRYDEARAYYEEGLALCRELGDQNTLSLFSISRGWLAWDERDHKRADALSRDCLRIQRELGNKLFIADGLQIQARARELAGWHTQAARLYAAAIKLYETIGSPREAAEIAEPIIRRQLPLDEASFAANWAIGRSLSMAEAIEYALGAPEQQRPELVEQAGGVALTPREREIVALIARGLTNRAIALHLEISPCTVNTHLRRIFDKAQVSSRGALRRWSRETGMALSV